MGKRQFLYDKVYSELKKDIMDGVYDYGSLLPSEKEIAARFAVERTTVRKALDLLVKEDLVTKHAGLGTKVSFERAGFIQPAASSNPVIGFFMKDDQENSRKITQPYYADLFYWLEIECKNRNCQLVYATIDNHTNITEILQSQNFLSVAFVTNMERQHIEKARELGIETVLVNEYYDDFLTISYDNTDGAYKVMKYLNAMGHKKIALISGPAQFYSSQEKLTGCLKAMHEFEMQIPKAHIMEGDWEFQSGYDCVKRLFQNLSKQERPTALFVFNDMMCIGAMRALREMSIGIPDDISVVGFDNMGQLQYTEPDLTTVDSHVAYMAKIIVENAVNRPFQCTEYGLKILVPVDLMIRGTVKKI